MVLHRHHRDVANRHGSKRALEGADGDVLLQELAAMGLSWGAMGKTGQGDGRLRRRKSWDSIMTPSFDSVPGLIPLDKVAKEVGELLVAMYGGSTSRALSSFDVSAIEEHSAAPPVPSATARTARTAAPPASAHPCRAGGT